MLFEVRRFAQSIYCPVAVLLAAGFFAAGHVFQIPGYPDGVDLAASLMGTYVVFTQFGLFILPALMMAYVCADFSEHAILFYRDLGFGAVRYHLSKTVAMTLFFSVGTVVGLTATCAVYGDFTPWLPMLLHCEAVVITYFSLYSMVSCLVASFAPAYLAVIAYSVAAVPLAISVPSLRFMQFFDQNGFVYKDFEAAMGDFSSLVATELPRTPPCLGYALAIVGVTALVMLALRRRWAKNGIR